jgi:hypothetical protein
MCSTAAGARYAFSFPTEAASFINDADAALGITPREAIVEFIARKEQLTVCGTGAPCAG